MKFHGKKLGIAGFGLYFIGFLEKGLLHQVHGISHLLKYRPLPLVLCFLFCLFGCSKALQKILQCNY